MTEDSARAQTVPAPAADRPGLVALGQPLPIQLPPIDVQQLWFSTMRWEWSTLVLVPADSLGSTLRLAKALAEIANWQSRRTLTRTDAKAINSSAELVEDITGHFVVHSKNLAGDRWKERTIIALDPVVTDPAGIPVAIGADAVLLLVELGKTRIPEAKRTVQLIGRDHFRGCVLLK